MSTSSIRKKRIICPQCGDEFTPNHGNRKHCGDNCKSIYGNEKAKRRRNKFALVDKKLKTNFETLERLLGNEKEITKSVEFMRGTGFDFARYTHIIEYQGKQCKGIYEFIIAMPDQHTVKIIRNA